MRSSVGHITPCVSASEDMSDLCLHQCVGPQVEQIHDLLIGSNFKETTEFSSSQLSPAIGVA